MSTEYMVQDFIINESTSNQLMINDFNINESVSSPPVGGFIPRLPLLGVG